MGDDDSDQTEEEETTPTVESEDLLEGHIEALGSSPDEKRELEKADNGDIDE